MSELKLPSRPLFAVACGKCASGKSYLIRHLLYTLAKQGRIKHGLAFVPSSFDNELNYFPKEHLHEKFSMKVLESYIEKLKAVKKDPKRKLPQGVLLLDNYAGALNLYKLSHVFFQFRHLNLTCILSTQMIQGQGSSTLCRSITDISFMFAERFGNNIRALHNAYCGWLENEREFKELLKRSTSDKGKYWCLTYLGWVDKKEEAYFSYKAPEGMRPFELKF